MQECFTGTWTGALQKIDAVMRTEGYLEILEQKFKTSDRKLKLGWNWVFQQDTDPECTSKVATNWVKDTRVKILA